MGEALGPAGTFRLGLVRVEQTDATKTSANARKADHYCIGTEVAREAFQCDLTPNRFDRVMIPSRQGGCAIAQRGADHDGID
jgi:hypothetical protein